MKDLGEAAYILGIKIYRDRSRHLIGLSQSTYLDKVLKKFKIDQVKKGVLPVLEGVKLSQTQCPTTAEDREKNERCSLCFSHRLYHVCNAVYQTRCVSCYKSSREVPK